MATNIIDYMADQCRGLWGTEWAMQKSGYLDSAAAFALSVKGRIVSVSSVVWVASGGNQDDKSSSHVFRMGAKLKQVPYFCIDVVHQQPAYNDVTGGNAYSPAFPQQNYLTALSALGGFEVATNIYDTTATYAVDDYLHAPTEDEITGSDKSAAGKLYNKKNWPGGSTLAVALTDQICGVVTDGLRSAGFGKTQLVFALWYHPVAA